MQSDKASVEITSPFDGTVKELLVKEGDIAKVGQGLCIIEVEDTTEVADNTGAPAGADSSRDAPSPPSQPTVAFLDPSPPPHAMLTPDASPRPHLDPLDSSHLTQAETRSLPSSSPPTRFVPAQNTLAAPSVRHFARKNSIDDLSILLPGSGKDGRIEMKDVESYLARRDRPQPSSSAPHRAALLTQEIELGRTRLAMYRAMTKVSLSWSPSGTTR